MISSKITIPELVIIVLNYNSWEDTIMCLESIQRIDNNYLTVVVDNNSTDGSIDRIKAWINGEIRTAEESVNNNESFRSILSAEYSVGIAEEGGQTERETEVHAAFPNKRIVIIRNDHNLGYSAGNNVGIRYALKKNADAVLIINPDIRLDEASSLSKMLNVMFSKNDIYVVGPGIIDANGNRQSPLREPGFFEECIRPFTSSFIKRVDGKWEGYVEPIKYKEPYAVEKIPGSCMLVRTSFLDKIGLLDENVFLYCEEPILATQVKNNKGKIYFVPDVTVRHLHKKPSSTHFEAFRKSRLYYLKNYRKYNEFKLSVISLIYRIIMILKT